MAVFGARALCFPSHDFGFARIVQRMLADRPTIGAGELERRLRSIAPSATVRARALSGERDQTFYVYRDGRWSPDAEPDWWVRTDTARATVSIATGAVIDANEALGALLGADRRWIIGRRYFDFVLPAARMASEVLFQTAVDTGSVQSIARVACPDGRQRTCEFRGEVLGAEIVVHVRAVAMAVAEVA
jgi:PAS domain-containing protein